jgi:hypothetical protein
MPNWCSNDLQVTGDKEKLKDFVSKSLINDDFRLSGLIPTPYELENTTSPNIYHGDDEHEKLKHKIRMQDLKDRYGYDNWYDWRNANWGVKWDTSDPHIYSDGEVFGVTFDSPWCPPITWLDKVAKLYPDLKFKLLYMEEGMCYCGIAQSGDDGEIVSSEGGIKYVGDNEREVEWDASVDRYRYKDTKEMIDDEDFSPIALNIFE